MTLKELRCGNQITQQSLAEMLGVSPRTIRAYENGTRRPSIKIAEKVGSLFFLTTDEIWQMFYGKREG